MICTGPTNSFDRTSSQIVLRAYFTNAKQPTSDDEFLNFWNSLSKMEKEFYLQRHLPILFYATKDV